MSEERYDSCRDGVAAGMNLGDTCSDCGHVVGIHTWPGKVCAACQGLQEIRDAMAPGLSHTQENAT